MYSAYGLESLVEVLAGSAAGVRLLAVALLVVAGTYLYTGHSSRHKVGELLHSSPTLFTSLCMYIANCPG